MVMLVTVLMMEAPLFMYRPVREYMDCHLNSYTPSGRLFTKSTTKHHRTVATQYNNNNLPSTLQP